MLYLLAALIYVLDQLLKWLVRAQLPVGHGIVIIPGVLEIDHIQNPGGAFSIFPNQTWLFILVALIVIVAVVYVHRKFRPMLMTQLGLGFLLGGALGNMTDRVITHSVTDYVYFSGINFPVFNLADASIDVGVILLLISSFRSQRDSNHDTKEDIES